MMTRKIANIVTLAVFCALFGLGAAFAGPLDDLKTPAEASNYTLTSTTAEVVEFCNKVAGLSEGRIRVEDLGLSPMGKPMVMMVMGNPAPAGPAQVGRDKVVAFVQCNIHPGEVEGKEAMLIFAREVAQGQHDDLLKDVVILINPNMSPDGNDMFGENRIDSQPEPRLVGSRRTAQGFNLNRDFMKVEAPETRSTMKVMREWKPVLFIDSHTTDGSRMRHAVTYHWSYNANTDKDLADFNSKKFIPAAMGPGSMLDVKYHRTTRPYGNFFTLDNPWVDNPSAGLWSKTADEDLPRYVFNYVGLRKMVSVLLECYSWDPFKTRVETQYACIYGSLTELAKQKATVVDFVNDLTAREEGREKNGLNGEVVVLTTSRDVTELIDIDSYVYDYVPGTGWDADENGMVWSADLSKPHTYKDMKHVATFTPVLTRELPAYYLIEDGCIEAVHALLIHDIDVYRLTKDVTLDAKTYRNFTRDVDPDFGFYEGHTRRLYLNGEWTQETETIPAGTYVVSTSQRHGKLAGVLLEPESNDGLASWNFFDNKISANKRLYPVKKSLADYGVIAGENLEKITLDSDQAVSSDGSSGCNIGVSSVALLALVPLTLFAAVKLRHNR